MVILIWLVHVSLAKWSVEFPAVAILTNNIKAVAEIIRAVINILMALVPQREKNLLFSKKIEKFFIY